MSAGGDAIVVLNAGSSSIKFCTFRRAAGALERELRGQVSGLGTAPRLTARRGDADDRVAISERATHGLTRRGCANAMQGEHRGRPHLDI